MRIWDWIDNLRVDELIKELNEFYEKGVYLPVELLSEVSLELSLYEIFYRAGYVDGREFDAAKDMIFPEVMAILEVHLKRDFKIKNLVISPEFDNVSGLMAEGDLIIDDALIEIKTSAQKGVKRDDFNQLCFYFILAKNNPRYSHITKIGFYYTRQDEMFFLEAKDVFENNNFNQYFEFILEML